MGLLVNADSDHQLTLSGFDFERRTTATLEVTVTTPGRMLVPARLLVDVAKVAGRLETLRVDDSKGAVTVTAGRARWTLPLLPHDEYPKLPDRGDEVGVVNTGDLRHAVRRVIRAAGNDPTTPMLTGIKLEGNADTLTLVATNRYQMAAAEIRWTPTDPAEPFSMLVPAELLNVAARAAGSDDDPMTLTAVGKGLLGFSADGYLTTGRVLDVEYPKWRGLMPVPNGRQMKLDAADLLRAIAQASPTSTDKTGQLTLTTSEDGTVSVSVTGDDRSAVVDFGAEVEGEPITIAFNSAYLKDALEAAGSERVTAHFGATNRRPMLVVGDDPDTYRHLVMPVSLPGAA